MTFDEGRAARQAANEALRVEIAGLREVQRGMQEAAKELTGKPMVDAMNKAALLVQRDAMINAPVDTGRLRSSITNEVRVDGNEVMGVVGTNVVYAPYMELGTGLFAGRPRYFPSVTGLTRWSQRHGASPYLVARAIYRRGGLRARRFMRDAVATNRERIQAIIEAATDSIFDRWLGRA